MSLDIAHVVIVPLEGKDGYKEFLAYARKKRKKIGTRSDRPSLRGKKAKKLPLWQEFLGGIVRLGGLGDDGDGGIAALPVPRLSGNGAGDVARRQARNGDDGQQHDNRCNFNLFVRRFKHKFNGLMV